MYLIKPTSNIDNFALFTIYSKDNKLRGLNHVTRLSGVNVEVFFVRALKKRQSVNTLRRVVGKLPKVAARGGVNSTRWLPYGPTLCWREKRKRLFGL